MRFEKCCIDCAKRQGLRIFGLSQKLLGNIVTTEDENKLTKNIEEIVQDVSPSLSPAELSYLAIRGAQEMAGCNDPFEKIKRENNDLALSLVPDLKKRIIDSPDPLYMACLLSACGNIIDLGIQENFDIYKTIEQVINKGFSINAFEILRNQVLQLSSLNRIGRVLYICDNAGRNCF